jgi:hypothetical protein
MRCEPGTRELPRLLPTLWRSQFGRKAERLAEKQLRLGLEDLERRLGDRTR